MSKKWYVLFILFLLIIFIFFHYNIKEDISIHSEKIEKIEVNEDELVTINKTYLNSITMDESKLIDIRNYNSLDGKYVPNNIETIEKQIASKIVKERDLPITVFDGKQKLCSMVKCNPNWCGVPPYGFGNICRGDLKLKPWCPPLNLTRYILSTKNCYYNPYGDGIVGGQIFTDKYILQLQEYKNYEYFKNKIIVHYDKIGVMGPFVYPGIFGHFPHEQLNLLMLLDTHLPANIPLLYPTHNLGKRFYDYFIKNNLFKKNRKIVFTEQNSIVHANKMYYLHWGYYISTAVDVRNLRDIMIRPYLNEIPKNYILVLKRDGSRRTINHDNLVNALRRNFPQVRDFVINP